MCFKFSRSQSFFNVTICCLLAILCLNIPSGRIHLSLVQFGTRSHRIEAVSEPEAVQVEKVVFVKTHKTASSTVQNIFHRKASRDPRKILLPKGNHVFSLTAPFDRSQVSNCSLGHPHFIIGHMRFNPPEVFRYIPPGDQSVYTTVLRDIPSVFESRVTYYGLVGKLGKKVKGSNRELAWKLLQNYDKFSRLVKLSDVDIFALGNWYYAQFSPEVKPTRRFLTSPPTNRQIQQLIQHMNETFHVVLITEMLDESLAVLQHKLQWPLEDFTYLSHNARLTKSSTSGYADAFQRLAREKLRADDAIYQFFKRRLRAQIREIGEGVIREKAGRIREMSRASSERCNIETVISKPTNHKFVVLGDPVSNSSDPTCAQFTRKDVQYCKLAREAQCAHSVDKVPSKPKTTT